MRILVLERVPLLEKNLADYAEVAGEDTIERIRAAAEPLRGARILHVNATAYGGGVAELLATHVPLLRDLGIEAEWQVIHGSDEFFAITKNVHNALQGADIEWTADMQRVYLEKVLDNALLMEGEFDYVVIHDPQPAAILSLAGTSSVNGPNTKWIWRCHRQLDPRRRADDFTEASGAAERSRGARRAGSACCAKRERRCGYACPRHG